jgi:hypothetical protein
MKTKAIIGLFSIIAILITLLSIFIIYASKKDGDQISTPTASLIDTFASTDTFMIVCTPPSCAIGRMEIYICPGVCPGGCGTTCATYTPAP